MEFQFDFSKLGEKELGQPAVQALQQHVQMQTLTPNILKNLRAQILTSNDELIGLMFQEEKTVVDELKGRNIQLKMRLEQLQKEQKPLSYLNLFLIIISWNVFLFICLIV